ncbi:MAG: polysaccharide deacetylase family protein [Leptolyngbyaceae cyanobacterium]
MQFAPLYPVIYQVLKPLFPDCLWAGSASHPGIALTFDDGPQPEYTLPLLDVLDQYGIKASFFWLGALVERSPQVAREVYRRGHWIGLHGYDHRVFTSLSTQELYQTLERSQAAITAACGLPAEKVRDVRPPNGLFTPQILTRLHQWGYRPVMWSVVSEDWQAPGIPTVVNRIMNQVCNGSLIVLHDGVYGGSEVVETTRQLLPLLLRQNYNKFLTVDQLWAVADSPKRWS